VAIFYIFIYFFFVAVAPVRAAAGAQTERAVGAAEPIEEAPLARRSLYH
jgi:hypothetical protein